MNFVIPKGKHKSSYRLSLTTKKSFRQMVEFTDSCIFTTIDPENALDINKLFGVSESIDPHENSARFGWRPKGTDKIEIFAYTYYKGERMVKLMTEVFTNSPYYFVLLLIDDHYHFQVNQSSVIMPRVKGWFRYKLWPYVGGTEPAQRDVVIDIS